MAAALGFDERGGAEVETAVSELAANVLKHRAVNGVIFLRAVSREKGTGIEVGAEDQGPGIADLAKALRKTPQQLAASILGTFARDTDDATILVGR